MRFLEDFLSKSTRTYLIDTGLRVEGEGVGFRRLGFGD